MRFDSMHALLAGYVTRGEIPGIVALVARRGEVHVDAMGTASLGAGAAVRRDTIFRVSSMTKPITAAATMALVDDGKLRLDEPVDRLLPELANRRVLRSIDARLDDTVPVERAITVRDLLTFTMGFGIVLAPPGTHPIQRACDELALGQSMPAPRVPPSPDTWLARFSTLPLMHQPGARWMYNTGCDVLGVLIARASGRTLDVFLRERIFAPLGMSDTSFFVPPEKRARFVTSYRVDAATGGLVVYDEIDGQWSEPPAFPSGAAGLVSTVDDLHAFGDMLLGRGTRGGVRVLSQTSTDAMMRDQLTDAQKKASDFLGLFERHGWGFGGEVILGEDVSGSPGAFGWDGGLGTAFRVDPALQSVTVLLTQRAWTAPVPPPVCHDFWRSARAVLTT